MTFTSTLTSKNQTTIPKKVIEALAAQPSTTLCFEIEPDGRVLLSAKSASFADLAGTFPRGKRRKSASLEEIDKAIREGAARRFKRSAQ